MAADLVLLGANPLDDVDNLRKLDGVMANGRWLEREAFLFPMTNRSSKWHCRHVARRAGEALNLCDLLPAKA